MRFDPIIKIGALALEEIYINDRLISNRFVKLIRWNNINGTYKFQIDNTHSDKHIYIKWNEYPEYSWKSSGTDTKKRIFNPLKQ